MTFFFWAVPGVPKPLPNRKRAFSLLPSSPTRDRPRVAGEPAPRQANAAGTRRANANDPSGAGTHKHRCLKYQANSLGFLELAAGQGPRAAFACASTTATAVMLTTPRAVTDGVRIWAGRAAPIRIGPTGSASASTLMS